MQLEATRWRGRRAWRLSDGRNEALVVPELSGRLLRFGAVGGPNLLWNAPEGRVWKRGEWKNWGGEKNWPAPQSVWGMYAEATWPPHPSWDQAVHTVRTLPGGALEVTGPTMEGWGVRCVRRFSFDAGTGELRVRTVLRKESGPPCQIAAWNVVQVPQPEAIYLRTNPHSPYRDGFAWFGGKAPAQGRAEALESGLLRVTPSALGGYKLGADAPVAAALAVRGGVGLRLRATRQAGQYPEGIEGAGFPVTLWNNGASAPADRYNEVEMMSPLAVLRRGRSLVFELRWSIHAVPEGDGQASAADRLLRAG